jgi:renalase
MSQTAQKRVAIVGGGISAACVASRLSAIAPTISITLFDQGRRGPGGRASHRAVEADDNKGGTVLPDDPPVPPAALEFDHGCQFFRADTDEMKELAASWCEAGWVAEWNGRFGTAGEGTAVDFFGLPSNEAPVYAGVGGMHLLPRRLLSACDSGRVHVRRGVRVAGMDREADGSWALLGVSGAAAFHDTADGAAQQAPREVLGLYDLVVLTDVSSSFGGWHRASAGVPEAFAARVRDRVRVPMFSAMVAFAAPLGLPLDGIAFGGEGDGEGGGKGGGEGGGVWFAARTQSKPGLEAGGGGAECWTLISTPRFATEEINAEPMQDAKTGAFKPQEDAYLNSGPAPALLSAFLGQTASMRPDGAPEPTVVYLQGQRWGSALPAPVSVGGRDAKGRGEHTVELMGVAYESATPPLVFPRPTPAPGAEDSADFLADDALGLYYAGDFTSRRAPGFEAAALAGRAAAEHIARRLAA